MDGHGRRINSRLNTSACCPTYESVNILQKAIAGSFYCATIPRQLSAHGPINQIQSTDRWVAFVRSDPCRRTGVEMLWNASLQSVSASVATTKEFVIPRHHSGRLPAYWSVFVAAQPNRLFVPQFVWINVISLMPPLVIIEWTGLNCKKKS